MPILMWQHGGALLSLHVGVSKAMRGRATYLTVPGFLGLHTGLVAVIVVSAEQWGGGLCTWFPLLVVVASSSVVVLRGRVSAEQCGGGLCTWFPLLYCCCGCCSLLFSSLSSSLLFLIIVVLCAQVSDEQQGWEPLTWFPSCPRVAILDVVVVVRAFCEGTTFCGGF